MNSRRIPSTLLSDLPAEMKLNARGQVLKSARCPRPTHADGTGKGTRSSNFLGEQQGFDGSRLWSFSCHHGGRPYHVFQTPAPADAPSTVEELEVWKQRQGKGSQKLGLA